jgi:hypothetical protein
MTPQTKLDPQTTTRGAPSAQQGQKPEQVTPRARADATAELGAEGGSYGDYTQSDRAHREWGGGAAERHATWRLAPAACLALLLVIAAIVATVFWAMGA